MMTLQSCCIFKHPNSLKMIGIEDLACYVPYYYLGIKELSEQRNISFDKLNKGLGLEKMAIANRMEDAATMAANAVKMLIERNNLPLKDIGRIYVGSESSFDGSKPIASYVLGMIENHFEAKGAMKHCDAADFTFACISGVDAFLSTVDWVGGDDRRIGIVVSTDVAKYPLGSPGEYTQGAGAVAVLVKSNPALIALDKSVGVACQCEHDFFKPLREIEDYEHLNENSLNEKRDWKVFDETPIYDGQFSNECYANRLNEAFGHFKEQSPEFDLQNWARIAFHLPYAFHAKRVFTEIYAQETNPSLLKEAEDRKLVLKTLSKSDEYKAFVQEKLEKGQRASSMIGNMYTASIWMALMSILSADREDSAGLENEQIGFCAYGSGSKAKVFQGRIVKGWEDKVNKWDLDYYLNRRESMDFETYERIHKEHTKAIHEEEDKFCLIEVQKEPLYGLRKYEWVDFSNPVHAKRHHEVENAAELLEYTP